ncbi:MAG TPA: N-carbamoyl-L-amino acid amidohydrolase [Thermoanaerobaculia bacterium]|jgi:hypothetical protein|nr:N-carbamoyl-L-amino acid amidohydrolase [Thermoanaerobaculia bacterium]
MTSKKSPYLSDASRLGDVIAAIQAMAVYKFYKLDFEGWADRISADSATAQRWKRIFEQHPEFFRLDTERNKASLVWRRQYPKRYDVDAEKILSIVEYKSLTDAEKERISRIPLTSTDISALVKAAIDLHSRALEQSRERRWWVPLIAALVGFLGAVLGTYMKC